MTSRVFIALCLAVTYSTISTLVAETLYGSQLIDRQFTFTDANRVFIDINNRLPNGRLRGFSMYIRPNTSSNRDHYARFCIWRREADMRYRLIYQTAARLPKTQGIYTIRIDDNVTLIQDDVFGVTFEQDTGTITHEVNVNGNLMFSDKYRNLPNTNEVITMIQRNYFHEMSLAAIVESGSGQPAPTTRNVPPTTRRITTTTRRPDVTRQVGVVGMTGWTGPQGERGPPGPQGPLPTDRNECPSTCQHKCVNTFMSFYCECNEGYELESNGRNCRNINECARNNGGCEHSCRDSQGSFTCSCTNGFRLSANQRSCEDDNECTRNPCSDAVCINTVGSYKCVYLKLLNEEGNFRQDIRDFDVVAEPLSMPNGEESSTDIGTVVWLSVLTVLVAMIAAVAVYIYRRAQRRRSLENNGQQESHESENGIEEVSFDSNSSLS